MIRGIDELNLVVKSSLPFEKEIKFPIADTTPPETFTPTAKLENGKIKVECNVYDNYTKQEDLKFSYNVNNAGFVDGSSTYEFDPVENVDLYEIAVKVLDKANNSRDVSFEFNAKDSLISQITSANYGNKVNYTINVNGTELSDWKIFGVSGENVMMICGGYLPNTTNLASSAGLTTYGTYGVYSSSRDNLSSILGNTSNWSGLISSGLSSKGATAVGAISLEQWKSSWNSKGFETIYTESNGTGLYVSTTSPATTYSANISSGASGYGNSLYFQSGCDGYWLTSPSAFDGDSQIYVGSDSSIGNKQYTSADCGLRPVIYLPSSVKAIKEDDGSWTID